MTSAHDPATGERTVHVTATPDDAGTRLDVWLSRRIDHLSRARIQSLIQAGHVTVPGRTCRGHAHVEPGMTATLIIPAAVPVALVPEDIPLDILFEDDDLIVLNKPPGLVVHPAPGHASGTLVHALLHHSGDGLRGIGGELRPGIVHRLDKDTSGAMVVAKHDQAMAGLRSQFKDGTVHKEYVALVHGTPVPAAGTVETLIGRSRHDRKKMSARPSSGRHAVTHYESEESFGAVTLLRLRIETGRTHQIRVHLSHIGHPVLGDRQYGRRGGHETDQPWPVPRQMLHARRLAFEHPRTGRRRVFHAPIPPDMTALLHALRHATAPDP